MTKKCIHYSFSAFNDTQQSYNDVPESFSIDLTYQVQYIHQNDRFKQDYQQWVKFLKGGKRAFVLNKSNRPSFDTERDMHALAVSG